jgi:hypothetical protein
MRAATSSRTTDTTPGPFSITSGTETLYTVRYTELASDRFKGFWSD